MQFVRARSVPRAWRVATLVWACARVLLSALISPAAPAAACFFAACLACYLVYTKTRDLAVRASLARAAAAAVPACASSLAAHFAFFACVRDTLSWARRLRTGGSEGPA